MCKGYHQGLPYLWYINCHKSHIKQLSKGKLHGLKGKTEKFNQICTFLFYFEVDFYSYGHIYYLDSLSHYMITTCMRVGRLYPTHGIDLL